MPPEKMYSLLPPFPASHSLPLPFGCTRNNSCPTSPACSSRTSAANLHPSVSGRCKARRFSVCSCRSPSTARPHLENSDRPQQFCDSEAKFPGAQFRTPPHKWPREGQRASQTLTPMINTLCTLSLE